MNGGGMECLCYRRLCQFIVKEIKMPVTTHGPIMTRRPDAEEGVKANVRKGTHLSQVRNTENSPEVGSMPDGYAPKELSADAFKAMLSVAPQNPVRESGVQAATAKHQGVGATGLGGAQITPPAVYVAVQQFEESIATLLAEVEGGNTQILDCISKFENALNHIAASNSAVMVSFSHLATAKNQTEKEQITTAFKAHQAKLDAAVHKDFWQMIVDIVKVVVNVVLAVASVVEAAAQGGANVGADFAAAASILLLVNSMCQLGAAIDVYACAVHNQNNPNDIWTPSQTAIDMANGGLLGLISNPNLAKDISLALTAVSALGGLGAARSLMKVGIKELMAKGLTKVAVVAFAKATALATEEIMSVTGAVGMVADPNNPRFELVAGGILNAVLLSIANDIMKDEGCSAEHIAIVDAVLGVCAALAETYLTVKAFKGLQEPEPEVDPNAPMPLSSTSTFRFGGAKRSVLPEFADNDPLNQEMVEIPTPTPAAPAASASASTASPAPTSSPARAPASGSESVTLDVTDTVKIAMQRMFRLVAVMQVNASLDNVVAGTFEVIVAGIEKEYADQGNAEQKTEKEQSAGLQVQQQVMQLLESVQTSLSKNTTLMNLTVEIAKVVQGALELMDQNLSNAGF